MDLANVDELAKDINSIKYLLDHPDLFNRTIDAKRMKTKDSKKMVREFVTIIRKKKSTP